MIHLKTKEELQIMQEGGRILKEVVKELTPLIKAGITTDEIDRKAAELIEARGGKPSFKTVKGYKWSICIPINEQVVHTPPSQRKIQPGDIVTLDIGVLYKGLHTDYATTLLVDSEDRDKKHLLKIGEETLQKGIAKARAGARLGEISHVIQQEIEGQGWCILKDLTGHGIGKELHEDPYVPNFIYRPIKNTLILKPGLTIAVEVIYSLGSEEIAYERGDDWSIKTADGSLSACFEHTIAITDENTIILT